MNLRTDKKELKIREKKEMEKKKVKLDIYI